MGFGRDLGAEATQTLAQLAERHGQTKKAAALYRALWLKHPLSPLAEHAEQRARALGLPAAAAADQVARAELVLAANRNPQAIALLTPLAASLKLKPRAAGSCEAHFALGKVLKKQRRHTEALREFGGVLAACKTDADRELRARTLYLAGQSAAVVDPEKARALFTELADSYPDNSFADDALFFAADVEAKNLGDPDAAKAALAALVSRYPKGDYAGEARFRLFWLARESGALKGGLEQLTALAKSGPEGAPRPPEPILRARYWLAQTAQDAGQLSSLAAEWPANYYSDLARSALAVPGEQTTPVVAPLPTALHAGTLLSDRNFQSALTLLRLGFGAAADEELLRVDRQGIIGPTGRAEPMLLLALALQRAGDPRSSHAIAKLLIESDDDFTPLPSGPTPEQTVPSASPEERTALTHLLFEIAYPRAFRQQIEKWSLAAKVPPDLLQGLMREESALDPLALSGAGAVGLCQLMPATGKRVAKKLGLGAVTAQQLQDPNLNIRLGAAYLGELLKRYAGRKPLAVAAYNAGEGAVDRWLAANSDQALDAFVEEIPIAETRHYVKRVLTSEAVYRTLPASLPMLAAQ
jgi:soluble lytic murein transglycosylase